MIPYHQMNGTGHRSELAAEHMLCQSGICYLLHSPALHAAWPLTLNAVLVSLIAIPYAYGGTWQLHSRVCMWRQVYKAVLDDVMEVAVKFLNSGGTVRANMRQFASEVDIMRACRATNIVTFIGALSLPLLTQCDAIPI